MPPASTEPKPLLKPESGFCWTNKHGNVTAKPKRWYEVWNRWEDMSPPLARSWSAGLAAFQEIIQTAEKLNSRVRCVGGGWSLSEAATTTGFMANTNPLNVLRIGLDPGSCHPDFVPFAERMIFAQCGVSVVELNRLLEESNLSLPTSGASNGQSIAGAISTGTHGAANQVGSMQDFILGLHLVSEGGKHYWIERKSRPVVSSQFCKALETELIQDDRLFNAVLVSFGCFGIIHAVLFKAEPKYLLERYVKRLDYPEVRPVLSTLDLAPLNLPGGGGLPFHFEVLINPYAAGAGDRGAYVRWMHKRDFAQLPKKKPDPTVVTGLGDDMVAVVAKLAKALPPVIPQAVTQLINSEYPEDLKGKKATHGGTFGATNLKAGGLSCELGVAVADTAAAVDAILDVAKVQRFAGVIALRFVKPSDALLAFTCFAPYTCTIELPAVNNRQTEKAYELIWTQLEQRNITHTFHWGQCARPSPAQLQQSFGPRLKDWLAARKEFLSPKGRRTFSTPMMAEWGLDA